MPWRGLCRMLNGLLSSGARDPAPIDKAKATFAIENCWAQTSDLKQLLICTFRQGDTGGVFGLFAAVIIARGGGICVS
ncbi:hypothetical protein GQ600_23989 [Phytophthora cactorum]|nr:hypothetical protein GQ600_23989 [Phytophthora cactorum]